MDMIKKKEHLTKSGFNKVLYLKSLLPRGLSPKLLEISHKENIVFKNKPVFEPSNMKLDHNWIAGFVQGDGTFGLNYTKQAIMKLDTITFIFVINNLNFL